MQKPVKSRTLPVRKTITAFMAAHGYQLLSEGSEKWVSRYTSHRGIPDGDFPNAHQSIATVRTTRWTLPVANDADVALLREALLELDFIDVGRRHREYLWMDRNSHELTTCWTGHGRGKRRSLDVSYKSTTQKPDLAFERSGRGHGQII